MERDQATYLGALDANKHIAELEAEVERLRKFAEHALGQYCWGYAEPDGADLQEEAERLGLIVEVEGGFDPEKHHDNTGCAEPGCGWYEVAWSAALTPEEDTSN